ncbi:unnamed protein product [Nezara viridula]|uniref:Uncharacterized protein n=1 Tax=Nezara viridula TaxID=85310 RepID=A0A9P0HTA8_NEZVI|nr:unnamed protein product [Nezara viridula]
MKIRYKAVDHSPDVYRQANGSYSFKKTRMVIWNHCLRNTSKGDSRKKPIKDDIQALDYLPKNDLQNLHLLNTKLLSAIYNDSQLRKDEQNNFMKIISQLSEVVKELKDQNSINNMIKKSNDLTLEPQALTIECQYGTTISPRLSPQRTNAERDCDINTNPLDLKDVQNLMSAWEQVSNESKAIDSNPTSVPGSVHSLNSLYYEKSERNFKLSREKSKTITKKLQNKIFQDKLKNLSLKLRSQGKYLSKTRGVLKQFQEQGKSIASVVEDIKHDQEKEKFVLETLINRIEKMAKNDELVNGQTNEIKDLEERIARIESRLTENNGRIVHKDKEIYKLMEELKQANLVKDEYQSKNTQLNKEISDCFIRLASNKKQIDELKESIRKERALNDSIKQTYEINLKNVVGNAVQEQRQIIQEIKTSFDNNIASLQTENSELKAKIYQLEEDGKRICNDSKIRVVKAKKQLYSQATVASQKLIKADGKIKEFYYTVEKLMKGIYYRLYEAELEQIKRKCHEEGGVQAASYILGVSATQMSRVLAAGSVPSLHEWMECCKRLVYKEKFAEDLAGFILSLFWPILPKDFAKGTGDNS